MGQSVIIVDYEAGNLGSVYRACEAVGLKARVSADPKTIVEADRGIFPGGGTAESAMVTLSRLGLDEALLAFAQSGRPLLGICLGLQILLDRTEEGDRTCLGLIPGECRRFDFEGAENKVPQIGWNAVNALQDHPIHKGMPTGAEFYFVHSFFMEPNDPNLMLNETIYIEKFCSGIEKENIFGVQYHPEKSHDAGQTLLKNFIAI